MALISIQNVGLAFDGPPLFDGINLSIERGEKVAVVGRNGSGKSTLLRLIEGSVQPDSGAVIIQRGTRTAFLSQDVPSEVPGTVLDVVAGGLKQHRALVTQYHAVSSRLSGENAPGLPEDSSPIQDSLEAGGGWEDRQQVNKVISQLGLNADLAFNSLSAGLKRQALLGRAIVGGPDILLLDEPTNHMDIDSINRLEEFLLRFPGALVFVTHDRVFLQRIATRIVGIDRGRLFDQSCDYETFLIRRQAATEAEETGQALFDKKLEKEERWIRQGIKARRTRNEGRVRELESMREIRRLRRERPGMVRMEAHEAERSGYIVAKAENISFSYGDAPVISNFSTTILKGDRVGILGRNGSGKTSLLRILLGELRPQSGTVRTGTGLQISYFDQLREQLDENKTVRENVGEGKDIVTINGKDRHVIGYLQDFLFSPERAQAAVSTLSGGEHNRLLLARLFTRPSNLLVLDEPTNDLDAETLELLEELLLQYKGTILLVSHDRALINNVVTSTIVFEGNGVVKEYAGGYDDWLQQRPEEPKQSKARAVKTEPSPALAPKTKPEFGFRQQKDLESIPQTIQSLESEQTGLAQAMCDPAVYKKDKSEISAMKERLESIRKALTEAYERWEELEKLKTSSKDPEQQAPVQRGRSNSDLYSSPPLKKGV
ncbi:MAG: ATP-binding cassette domain-containing protein [Chloroflexi bacterium]|nr:ATP-binding cassette domain-containing protein [Chloroflexota bacterium]